MTDTAMNYLEMVRAEELTVARAQLPAAPKRILEIGGGNGYQASLLTTWGYEVKSIDIEPPDPAHAFFDVQAYDGHNLPFGDEEFDCVFSSNVLEHIRDLEAINGEIRRVLKPGGVAVHVLPSSAWRFWTSLAHYPYIVKFLLSGGRHSLPTHATLPRPGEALLRRGVLRTVGHALFPTPHGEYGSSLTELYTFSRVRWSRVFRGYGFNVITVEPASLFYTGYGLLARRLSVGARRRLAHVFGSAAQVFVLRVRAPERPEPDDRLPGPDFKTENR